MTLEPAFSIRKQKTPVKKRKHHAEAVKICKHHPMSSGLRCVKRWTKQIIEKRPKVIYLQIFKSSDACRPS